MNIAELETEVSPAAYRVLDRALKTGRTSFADLDALMKEDTATQARLGDVRAELESIGALPYSTESGERFGSLILDFLNTDPRGLFSYLDELNS